MAAEIMLKPLIKASVGNSLFMNVGQMIDGPQNGPAPPPWSIPAQPNQIFTPQVVNIEVPHTASVKVKLHKQGICILADFINSCRD